MRATPALPGRPPGIRKDADGLTARQRAVLTCVAESLRMRGYPPSMREIGASVDLASTSSVAHQLHTLQGMGLLCQDPNRPRTYVPTAQGRRIINAHSAPAPSDAEPSARVAQAGPTSGMVQVPLVGRIAAGAPILAEQAVQDVLAMPVALVGHGELFALKTVGQSMRDAGILDGDIVTVRRQASAEPGDIVAALTADGEATVKRLRITDDGAWLVPCNADFSPIPLGEDGLILGKVVAVLRSL